ncbi:MAG TPA: cyclic nucleotide-binding and patatin-like phospholipase domain-containing protein [Chlamydiales bacterium]|jgi:predicted acylesterase/phospholipase RssA
MIERPIPKEEIPDIISFLASLDLFKKLDRGALEALVQEMTLASIGGGETFIHEGKEDPTLYILLQGRLRVYSASGEGSDTFVDHADISVGEIVGEIAILTNFLRTASVRAVRDSLALKLNQKTFEAFEKSHPEEVVKIAKTAIRRVTHKPRPTQPGENVTTIAVIPAGKSNHVPFAERLAKELNQTKPTTLITKALCNERFSKEIAQAKLDEKESVEISQWFTSLEMQGGYLIYETDSEMTPWTERCIRQADRLFLVADSTLSPELNAIETELFNHKTALSWVEMIFIHPKEETLIAGSNGWLVSRAVNNYHHLTLSSDFARLCRFLTGKAFGVVLSGGGARGFAHTGALKALQKLGIPIDFIGGTSMGSVVAGGYAKLGLEKMLDICYSKDFRKISKDYTFPIVSLLKGKEVSLFYERTYGESYIEDLRTRFFCVSTNVTHLAQQIHTQGLLKTAIRASTSIPALYPPIYDEEGNMLVDGGIVNNLPVDVMRKLLGGGKILAIDCQILGKRAPKKVSPHPWISGWKLLFQKINPFNKKKDLRDSLFDILRTSLGLSSLEKENRMGKEADFLLELDMSRYNLLDFKNAPQIVEIGYTQAMEKLPSILKKTTTT